MESIQVLRGPQGTLFGKNTASGALLITSVKPHDTFAGEIAAPQTCQDESEPDLRVEILDDIPPADPLADEVVARYLQQTAFLSNFWFNARDWYPELREPAAINRFQTSEGGTDERSQDLALAADVQYMLGWWQLAADEALVIEGQAPESPYWIIQLADRWLDTGGRKEGLMAFRWALARDVEQPTTRVVKLADL